MHLTKNMRKVLEVLANSAGPLSPDQIAHRAQLDAGVAERALATLVREYVLVGEQAVIAQVSVIMYRFHSSQKAQHISQRYQLLRRGTAQTLSYDLHLDGALELILSSLQYEQEQETLNSETIVCIRTPSSRQTNRPVPPQGSRRGNISSFFWFTSSSKERVPPPRERKGERRPHTPTRTISKGSSRSAPRSRH